MVSIKGSQDIGFIGLKKLEEMKTKLQRGRIVRLQRAKLSIIQDSIQRGALVGSWPEDGTVK